MTNFEDIPKEGEILDKGMCKCAICGRRRKMGATIMPAPERPTIMILCKECTIRSSAERHGISYAEAKRRRDKMFATTNLSNRICVENYFKLVGKEQFSDIDEANAVLQVALKWWNEELTIEDRKRIENMPLKKQEEYFRSVPHDFFSVIQRFKSSGTKIGRNDPCPCGSGKKYKKCCLNKLH